MSNGSTTIQYVFANFFESELVAGLTAGSTVMMISPSDAEDLPVILPGSSAQAMLAIWDGQLPPEIVAVTQNDQSGTMVIARAQESTVPQAWASGTQVRCAITAGILNTALAAYFDIGTVLNAHFLSLAGGTLTGPLTLAADPTIPLQAATKEYVDNTQGTGLPLSGGTMHGNINMANGSIINLGAPVSAGDAVNKNYVDTVDATLAPLAGPALTGVPTAPTAAPGTSTTQLATTAFATAASGGASGAWGTGDVKLTYKTVADVGWIIMDDTTIGGSNSNAAHKDLAGQTLFQALFSVFWAFPAANCPMFTAVGASQPRGASAAQDYTNGYSMSLPKVLGRALAVAGAGAGLTNRPLSSTYGVETYALTAAQQTPHRHVGVVTFTDHAHGYEDNTINVGSPAAIAGGPTYPAGDNPRTTGGASYNAQTGPFAGQPGILFQDGLTNANSINRTSNALEVSAAGTDIANWFGNGGTYQTGSGATPHENMPPETFLNVMVKQ
jgi:hypothetical protein